MFGVTAYILATWFSLLSFGDPKVAATYDVFIMMAMGGWVMIGVYFVYTRYRLGGKLPVDFDNDITQERIMKTVLAYVGLIAVAFLAQYLAPGQLSTVSLGVISIAKLFYIPPVDVGGAAVFGSQALTELLRQVFIVAHGEELLKATSSLVFAAVLQGNPGLRQVIGGTSVTKGMALSIGFTTGIWSLFHGMRATPSAGTLIAIFACGIVLAWHLVSTGCVILTCACHAMYNITVLLLQGGLSVAPAAFLLLPLPFLCLYFSVRWKKDEDP